MIEHLAQPTDEFAGLPLADFVPERVTELDPSYAWRLASPREEGAEGLHTRITRLVDTPGAERLRALVLPALASPYGGHGPIAALVAAADRLPSLTAVYLGQLAIPGPAMGDWIHDTHGPGAPRGIILVRAVGPVEHEDVTSLLRAYPGLEVLWAAHDSAFKAGAVRHESLRELVVIVSHGVGATARHVGACELPALQRLELCVNVRGMIDLTVDDLASILTGTHLPRLTTLGLHCSDLDDVVAAAVAGAAVVSRLHTFAMSGGALSDRGVEALLSGQPLTHLRHLNLRDQRVSSAMAARLVAELPGVAVDVSTWEQRRLRSQKEDYDRKVAAGEVTIDRFAGLPIEDVWLADDEQDANDESADSRGAGSTRGLVRLPPWGDWRAAEKISRLDAASAWRLSECFGEQDFGELLAAFADTPGLEDVRALIIGDWGECYDKLAPVDDLVALADRLPNLAGLFIGDIESETCEISWITLDDITPVFAAFPKLEVLKVRGSKGLELYPVDHRSLRKLVCESGGLPGEVVRGVAGSDLPALEHLELWLGTERYFGDSTVDDLTPILAGTRFPALRTLALRDAEIADEVAEALAGAPVVARLHTLDLSLGALSDRGAEALLSGQPLTHLKRLDVHHHFLSDEMAAHLVADLPGVEVNVSDPREDEGYGRYIAVSE